MSSFGLLKNQWVARIDDLVQQAEEIIGNANVESTPSEFGGNFTSTHYDTIASHSYYLEGLALLKTIYTTRSNHNRGWIFP